MGLSITTTEKHFKVQIKQNGHLYLGEVLLSKINTIKEAKWFPKDIFLCKLFS